MKKKKLPDKSKVLGNCYLCGRTITVNMLNYAKAVAIGKGEYRCRRKKCEQKVKEGLLKQTKTGKRNVWTISPVTKVIPNKKKKSRAKIKDDMRREE